MVHNQFGEECISPEYVPAQANLQDRWHPLNHQIWVFVLSWSSVAQVAPTTYAAAMEEGGATWELQWAEEAGMGCIWAL